jgi:hypothetical protein
VPYLVYNEKAFIGYQRYEEDDNPTLLYVQERKLITEKHGV